MEQTTRILGAFTVQTANSANFRSLVIIMVDHILVFDSDRQLRYFYKGFKFGSVLQGRDWEIYAVSDAFDQYTVREFNSGDKQTFRQNLSAGLYFFDATRVADGTLELYKVAAANVGINP